MTVVASHMTSARPEPIPAHAFLALNCSLELAQMSCDVIVFYLLRL